MLSFIVPRSPWKVALWLAFLVAVLAIRLGVGLFPESGHAELPRCTPVAGSYASYSCEP